MPEAVLFAGLTAFLLDQTDAATSAFKSTKAVAIMAAVSLGWLGLEEIDIQPGPDYDLYLVPGTDRQDTKGGIRLDDLPRQPRDAVLRRPHRCQPRGRPLDRSRLVPDLRRPRRPTPRRADRPGPRVSSSGRLYSAGLALGFQSRRSRTSPVETTTMTIRVPINTNGSFEGAKKDQVAV